MNPNLTQSRRGAEKTRLADEAPQRDSMVGLACRCRPKPQARTRRSHIGPTPRSESTGWLAYFIRSFRSLVSDSIAL
jgi:hypothetical protein